MRKLKKIFQFKNIAYAFLLFFLWIPLIQNRTQWIEIESLYGAIPVLDKPAFELSKWLDGEYQTKMTTYRDQNFGYRNLLVRFHNQLLYSFFGEVKANGVVIGKEDYLYEDNYIKSYLGLDYVRDEKIKTDVTKLQRVQDTLKKLNIQLFVLIAPGKGTFFPEYFPANYSSIVKRNTNYEKYSNYFKRTGICFLDFNQWFLNMKKTSLYPLYSKGGIHWSKYGEVLACDSLIRFIEKMNKCYMPRLVIDTIEIRNENSLEDNDIGSGLNLLFKLNTYPMAYPQFHFEKDQSKVRQKVICVADSYYWGMFNFGISNGVFDNGKFWFYNEQIYPDSYEYPKNTHDINIKQEIEKQNIIIILTSEMNLNRFSFGFVDQLYDIYYPQQASCKL